MQSPKGQRLTGDSVLLCEFVLPLSGSDRVMDLGAATGAIPLILAWKSPAPRIVGVEVVEGLVAIARRNVVANDLAARVEIIEGDWRGLPERFAPGSFDVVVSNPPYRAAASSRVSPGAERAAARSEVFGALGELIEVAGYLLAPEGRACFVFTMEREAEMFRELEARGLVPVRVRYVHPSRGRPARLFLVEARRKRVGSLTVEEPVYMG